MAFCRQRFGYIAKYFRSHSLNNSIEWNISVFFKDHAHWYQPISYLSQDNELPILERMIMQLHFWLKEASLSEERGFGLDVSAVTVEKFPLIMAPVTSLKLKRVEPNR